MNIPLALGVLFTMLKEKKSEDIYKLALDFDAVFGLSLDKTAQPEQNGEENIPEEIMALVEARAAAKKAKDYKTADQIRDQIIKAGYLLSDTKEGTFVKKSE